MVFMPSTDKTDHRDITEYSKARLANKETSTSLLYLKLCLCESFALPSQILILLILIG